MVPTQLWGVLAWYQKRYPELRVYAFGDWNQLPPVEEVVYDYSRAYTVMNVCGYTRITFEKNYRFGAATEDMLDRVLQDPASLSEFDWGETLHVRTLVHTHSDRKRVNHRHMEAMAAISPGEWIERNHKDPMSQRIYLHVGLPVISFAKVTKLGIMERNATYKVTGFDGSRVDLVPWEFDTDRLKEGGGVLTLTRSHFQDNMFPAYALTVHVVQGATIDGHYSVLNAHRFRDKQLLYTALSRCRDMSFVSIPTWEPPRVDRDQLIARLKKAIGQLHGASWDTFIDVKGGDLPRGFTWYDYGLNFEIDHIRPKESFKQAGQYAPKFYNDINNLRAVPIRINRSKKDLFYGVVKS
jgi:hypothetical protein